MNRKTFTTFFLIGLPLMGAIFGRINEIGDRAEEAFDGADEALQKAQDVEDRVDTLEYQIGG